MFTVRLLNMTNLKIFRDTSPFSQLMLSFFVIILSTLVMLVFAFISGLFIFDISLMELQEAITDVSSPENVVIMKYFQTVQAIGLFIIPPIVIAFILSDSPWKYLSLERITGLKSILLVILAIYLANPVINYLAELNSQLSLPEWMSGVEIWMHNAEESAAAITKAFLEVDSFNSLLFNVFMIGMLPAIGEELLFRGVIQKLFKNITKNNHAAIWISAALFSALHMQFFGFLPRLLLGAMFGYFLVWGGSLWVPIIAHFINNASAVIFYYLYSKGLIGQNFDEIGTASDGSSHFAIISLVLVATLMWLFYKIELKQKTLPHGD
jgi:membrane protease YdiL (CAAX protease family)